MIVKSCIFIVGRPVTTLNIALRFITGPCRELFNSFNQKRGKQLSRKQFRALMRSVRVNLTQQQVSLLLLRFALERRSQQQRRNRDKDEPDRDACVSWYEFEILCGVCGDLIQQNGSGFYGSRRRAGEEHASSIAAVSGKIRRFFAERVLMRGEEGDNELNAFEEMDHDGDGVLSHVEFEASVRKFRSN